MADKLKDYNAGYSRGLEVALKLANEGGPDAILQEIKYRGKMGAKIPLSTNDLLKATEGIRHNILQSVCAMMLLTIHDEFGFGHKRLTQLFDRFMFKCDCLVDPRNLFCWQDVHDILEEECKMDLQINVMEEQNELRRVEEERARRSYL